ncbi:protein PAXX isoform X1 [Myiozetetes cayanensis]|uniref:protein PAXX isoform X1 n=1 Tax=Myiozetetes cayanensis TaxID=478635 RepID=UPI00216027D8|nr:protein PAXX isoform X1 [Myiozetetes cayanensis]
MRWRSGPRTSATVRRLAAYVPGPGSAVGLAPEARGAGGAEMDSARVRPCRTCSPPPPSLQRCPPEEHSAMLRAALGRGTAELSLGPGSATLRLPEEPRCPALALAQLPPAEARRQLQALVFGMAGCIETLERRLEAAVETLATSCSPQKNSAQSQQLFLPGRHCQRHLPWSCCPAFSFLEAAGPAFMCSSGHTEYPWLWLLSGTCCPVPFLTEQGQGSLCWLSGYLGCSGHRLVITSLRRRAVLLDWEPGQVHGSFGRGGQAWPFLTLHGCWPYMTGLLEAHPGPGGSVRADRTPG